MSRFRVVVADFIVDELRPEREILADIADVSMLDANAEADLFGKVEGVDAIVHVVDAAAGIGRGDAYVYEQRVRPHRCPAICAVNKVDAVGHHRVVPQLAEAAELGDFAEIVPISAKNGTGIDRLRDLILDLLPEGPVAATAFKDLVLEHIFGR